MSKQNIAIGIDLGTTYTCAAWCNDGKVQTIPNELGKSTTPSVVSFTSTECLVGKLARDQLSNLANTVFDAKRMIGRPYNDRFVQQDLRRWPFRVINDDNKPKIEVEFKNEKQSLLPQQISARILARVKKNAEAFLGQEVRDAVITVPALFNQNQREATMDAGRIAGFNVLRVLSEPTAAAVAYGIDPQQCPDKPMHVLVYDLGGGTFDVSIIKVEHGIFDVLATVGDTHLGGNDFDEILAQFFAQEFKRKNKIDVSNDKRAMRRLRLKCEKAKRDLSSAEETKIFLNGFYGGNDASFTISRSRFADLCEEHFCKTIKLLEKALEDAKLRKDEIDHVVLVGGSTRIVRVQELLQEFFGESVALRRNINADEAVAHGAAKQAAMLCKDTSIDVKIQDATNLSLGIETDGGVMTVIVPRNKPLPASGRKSFTTVKDFQNTVIFSVFQGERPLTSENVFLCTFSLEDIPPALKGEPDFLVTFEIDVNCVLRVTAIDEKTGQSKQLTIGENKFKLADAEIEKMLKLAEDMRESDAKRLERIKAKSDLESFVYDNKKKARTNNGMTAKQKTIIDKCGETIDWIESNGEAVAEVFKQKQVELAAFFASLT